MNKTYKLNIMHYESLKPKLITRSALTAERFAMVHGFDVSSTIRLTISDFLGHVVALRVLTASRSLFHCLTKTSCTAVKCLLVDSSMLRQAYERREITNVFWIPTAQNQADGFIRAKPCKAPKTILDTNLVHITTNA